MKLACTKDGSLSKKIINLSYLSMVVSTCVVLSSCSTNPATGERQFTGFMSPAAERQAGATEHSKVLKSFGGEYKNAALQSYVKEIGTRLVPHTERKDVAYTFTLLDSPVINAFALPGGYTYVTRGLVAAANSEAELAGVIAHEIGHVTGRHGAERYSTGILTQIGATVASAAIGSSAASQAIGLGSNLFLSSYSRGQETESDELGIRYLHRAGYDPMAMATFLRTLEINNEVQSKLTGKASAPSFFSTHPNTAQRVSEAGKLAASYPANDAVVNRDRHMNLINGMSWGDTAEQGFIRGSKFYHPEIGFTYTVPDGYRLINKPKEVLAVSDNGSAIILDAAKSGGLAPDRYITSTWLKGESVSGLDSISINGMPAATATFNGQLNGRPSIIRVVAIQFSKDQLFRFQMTYPKGSSSQVVEDLKRTTYSFRKLTDKEKAEIQATQVKIFTAKSGDTVRAIAQKMAVEELKEEQFRALNGLSPKAGLVPGSKYKLIVNGAR